MAKSLFWPTYVAVSAAVLYGTWAMTPVISEKFLSPSSRETIRDLVAACVRHPLPAPTPQATTTATPANGTSAAPSPKSKSAAPAPASGKTAVATPVRTSAKEQSAEEDELPSLLGVQLCQPGKAAWGVLNHVTTVTKRDGSKISIPGGRFFIIKSREADGRSYRLVGTFAPNKLGETVTLSSDDLFCFTGSPDKLSQRQRKHLRSYYELRGKAMARKDEILSANAAKSPYGNAAAEALSKFRSLSEKVKQLNSNASSDENRKLTYELAQIKGKYQELIAKHKAWKQAHASELANPEHDSEYQRLLKEAQTFAEPICGMTY